MYALYLLLIIIIKPTIMLMRTVTALFYMSALRILIWF
jgi:hypothetical protein